MAFGPLSAEQMEEIDRLLGRQTTTRPPVTHRESRAGSHRATRPCSSSILVACPRYLPLTLMTLGLVSSALGKVSLSTPSSNTASALSACTGTFSVSLRAKVP